MAYIYEQAASCYRQILKQKQQTSFINKQL
jgi:hypothetical protein